MNTPENLKSWVDFLLTGPPDFETLQIHLKSVREDDRAAALALLERRTAAAAEAGRPAEAEWLAFLADCARRVWRTAPHDQGLPGFAAVLDRAVKLGGLLDAFLLFRRERAVLPEDPVPAAQKLLGAYEGVGTDQRAAVLAALAMATPDAPMAAVQARTWWAFGLMARASWHETRGQAGTRTTLDRRHALFHATRAVEALRLPGGPTPVPLTAQQAEVAYWAYGMLAQAHRSLGDLRSGIDVLLECERRLRHLDDDPQRWIELDRVLANELQALGHHRAARPRFDRVLESADQVTGGRANGFRVNVLIARGKNHLFGGALTAASADFRQAADDAEALGLVPEAVQARSLLANSLQVRGRSREALRVFEENLAATLRDRLLRPHALRCALAQQLRQMGYLKEAEEQYRLALAEMHEGTATRSANEVGCLSGLGDVAEARGDRHEAMAFYERSYRTASAFHRESQGIATLAMALKRQAEEDGTPGMAEEALRRLTRLRQDAEALGNSDSDDATGLAVISCLTRLDRWAEAAALGRELIARADERGGHDDGTDRLGIADGEARRMNFVDTFRGRPELRAECLAYALSCRDESRRQVAGTPWPAQRAEVCGRALPTYEALMGLLADHGDELSLPDARSVPEWCFDLHEEVKARDLLTDLSHAASAVPPPPRSAPGSLLAEEDRLLRTLRHDATRSALGELGLTADASADRITTRLAAVHSALESHAPEYVRLRRGAPMRLAEARELIRRHAPAEGMVLVSYFCGKDDTYCFVLTSDDASPRMHRIPLGRSRIEALSRRLRIVFNGGPDASGVLLRPLPARRPGKRDTSFLAELTPLLEPFADLVGDRRLVAVAAHGPLSGVPFAALPLPSGGRLGESNAVVNVPGVSSLRHLLAHPAAAARRAVSVGCAGREDDTALFEHDGVLLAEGPWQSVPPLAGLAATPDAVRDALARADLAHVTAHGFADTDDPLDAALLFSDGATRPSKSWEPHNLPARARHLLRVRDVASADAAPHRLVLRACSAGWGEADHPGADLAGLTWAFLRSGSRCVIAPRWDVHQESSRELLAAFYRRLGRGKPRGGLCGEPSGTWRRTPRGPGSATSSTGAPSP